MTFALVLILSAPGMMLPPPEVLHLAPLPAAESFVMDSALSPEDCPAIASALRGMGLPVVCELESN
jgi:hypothetical protein